MRSFEFVEGGSAKFWEIQRDGNEVTVRWGRVGTNGQTKAKAFDDPAAATTHETKLIAEKVKKGYLETAATTAQPISAAPAVSSAPVVEPDEDTFVFPPSWYRHRHARRTSVGVGRFVPDPNARAVAEEEADRRPGMVQRILEAPTTPDDVRRAAFAWRRGDADAPAIGGAAVAAAAGIGNWSTRDRLVAYADVWIGERGLRYAAEAAVHLMALLISDDAAPRVAHYTGNNRYGVRPMRAGESRQGWHADLPLQVVLRVRQALAGASDEDYSAVVAALESFRGGHAYARMATSLLAPDRVEWVAEDVDTAIADADSYRASALTAAVGTGEQLTALVPQANGYAVFGSLAMLTTLVDGTGPAAAPALFHWIDEDQGDADARRRLLSMVSMLTGDAPMRGLIERIDGRYVAPALLDAAGRFPARAMRLLAEGGAERSVAEFLRAHMLAHPGLVDQVIPELDADAAARVRGIVGDAAAVTVAPAEAVPPLLVTPPWLNRTRPAKPVVLTDLVCADRPTIAWLPDEREEWRSASYQNTPNGSDDWAELARLVRAGRPPWWELPRFFDRGPEPIVRSVLAKWDPRTIWEVGSWMRLIVARFELDALPSVMLLAFHRPAEGAGLLLPFASPKIAVLMADWLARLKSLRPPALAWLLRHPEEAARALVPPASGKPGPARRQAERALLTLHTNGHTEAIRAAAQGYGSTAADAIERLLAGDPLAILPARLPAIPAWAVPGLLPPVRLRGGAGALPADAVTNLITVLAVSSMDDPYEGLEIVKEACEPASLAEFAWGLFQRWQASGGESKENWVLDVLGLVGDDETVRRLTPVILAWPGQGGHARAVTGVRVLAAIGSDVALMHLHGIAQRAKFKGLKTAAGEKMDEVAASLGLTADQLADRLVPDFGLEQDGSMCLDYGPRHFVVGFDEQLRPFVADAAGKHLKALPKPGTRDDQELAQASYKQFSALKKDVRTVAADQIRRLERAMVAGRRWTGVEFGRLFVDHPLLWHIVRRLVWAEFDADGRVIRALRVAEDRSLSTVDDDVTTLADDATVGVAHPLHLGDSLAAWSEVFADYEILQPFPQLSRPTFALTEEETKVSNLARFEGVTLSTHKLLGLERRGWRREAPQDAGIQGCIEVIIGKRLEFAINLDPGIAVGMLDEFTEQKLTDVFLHDGNGTGWGRGVHGRIPLARLDPITASEIIRDLTEISA
jgi:predicted DNA-binding WGR domain protein